MAPTSSEIGSQIKRLLESNDHQEIERFLRNPPIEIEEDERLHQKVVVLHDRIGSIDPLVSAHVFWQTHRHTVILDQRHVGELVFTVSAASVLDQTDASYVVAGCDATLDPTCFPKGGLMQHIQRLEGSEFFAGSHRPPQPLEFLGLWEIESRIRPYRYLFINMEKNERQDYTCSLDDILKAVTRSLEYTAGRPQASRVAIPALGWHHLSPEDKEVATREILHLIERFCKKGQTGNLEEIRLSLYSLEAALTFSKTLNETKQQHIEVLNMRLADARRLASERTDLFYEFHDPAFQTIRERINSQLDATHPIVFVGESGVGKQFFGAYVHSHGPRREQPFQVAGVRDSMERDPWESLTGKQVKEGDNGKTRPVDRLMAANKGTLLIKRLEQIPAEVQELLVHFLNDGTYYPIGSDKPKSLDVRVLFASREPLDSLLQRGSLIPDLYRRLEPYVIELPPLRKRPEDILPIATMWLKIYRDEFGFEVTDFDDEVKTLFQSYDWPTNVDQLQCVVEDAVRYAQRGVITRQHVPLQVKYIGEVPPAFAKRENLFSDYLKFRRQHGDDWERMNRELTENARVIIGQLIGQKPVGEPNVAALLKRAASENVWPAARRVLVARRVFVGIFRIRKPKLLRYQGSTIRLLGYVDEGDEHTTQKPWPKRGALAKYLCDIGLTLSGVGAGHTDDLFPEEIQMLNEVRDWKMGKTG